MPGVRLLRLYSNDRHREILLSDLPPFPLSATEFLRAKIRDVADFPKTGILFKDITPLLEDAGTFSGALQLMADAVRSYQPTKIVAIESRGFIFGSALAQKLNAGLVLARKPGKLPYRTSSVKFALEYGSDQLEMHIDSLTKEDRVVIVDDILATGGTAKAAAQLVENSGARVEALLFLSELAFLNGRSRLAGHNVITLMSL